MVKCRSLLPNGKIGIICIAVTEDIRSRKYIGTPPNDSCRSVPPSGAVSLIGEPKEGTTLFAQTIYRGGVQGPSTYR
jgi:hypothetical protein